MATRKPPCSAPIEPFTRVDRNALEDKVTVEDPTTWTKPWTAMILLDKLDDKTSTLILTQQTCHDGNYGLTGMLNGHRAAERAFAEGRGPDPFTLDRANGRDLTLPDGRTMFLGSSGTGAPADGKDASEKK